MVLPFEIVLSSVAVSRWTTDTITLNSNFKSYPTTAMRYRNLNLWSACTFSKKGITSVIIIVNAILTSPIMIPQYSTLNPRNDTTSVELLTTVQVCSLA